MFLISNIISKKGKNASQIHRGILRKISDNYIICHNNSIVDISLF